MTKKKSLTAALSEAPPVVPAPAESPASEPTRRSAPTAPRSDRAGKTNITGYFDKPVKWELQDLATERSRALGRKVTVQQLLAEALNDLFKKYGKPEIVPREFQDAL
jgi:hypothetical protein